MIDVVLKNGRERSLARRHPWIFSGAIDRVEGKCAPGDLVRVVRADGEPLACGYYNEASKIQVRILDHDPAAVIDGAWWRRRIQRAVDHRKTIPGGIDGDALRIVYSEADGIPGLIVDRYADCLVLQALTAGIERAKNDIVAALGDLLGPRLIYERSDTDARALEGLPHVHSLLAGEEPQAPVLIAESIVRFYIDIEKGHKTGFYIDQRENRRRVSVHATGRNVLDLFSYSGGFGIYALKAGAEHVTMVDSSAVALGNAHANAELNGVAEQCELVQGNAFEVVRDFQREGRSYGLVVCDPPRLASSRGQLARAERAYKDINLHALRLIEPGGFLATFSCSGTVSAEAFSKVVAWAAIDAGREVRILHRLSQGPDHPVDPCFPESEYLKGFICRVE